MLRIYKQEKQHENEAANFDAISRLAKLKWIGFKSTLATAPLPHIAHYKTRRTYTDTPLK